MSKKLFELINGITIGIGTIAAAVVTYTNPTYAVAIVSAIGIGEAAISEILALFIDPTKDTKKIGK